MATRYKIGYYKIPVRYSGYIILHINPANPVPKRHFVRIRGIERIYSQEFLAPPRGMSKCVSCRIAVPSVYL